MLQGSVTVAAGSGPDATGATFYALINGAWTSIATGTSHDSSWNWTTTWNTAATSGGTRLYPNGPYQLGVQLQYPGGPGQIVDGPMTWVGDGPVLAGEMGGGSNPAETDVIQPSTKASDRGSDASIGDTTGALNVIVTDSHVPGNGLALDLTRTYDSTNPGGSGPFGYGWTDTYSMTVTPDPVYGSGVEDVTTGDGAVVRFAQNSAGSWVAPTRVEASLSHNTTNNTWTLVVAGRNSYVFNSTGQLISQTDLNGYVTTLAYTAGQLSTVTDPAGRTLTFTWGACGAAQCVSSVTDPAGRVIRYGYDSNANLTSVQDVAGNTTTYGYDTAHRVTSVKDALGNTSSFAYNSANQVTSETDPLNNTSSWAYSFDGSGDGTTTATDPLGDQTHYTFTTDLLMSVTQAYGTSSASTTSYTYPAAPNYQTSLSPPADVDTDGPATQTTPAGITQFAYNPNGGVTSQTDPDGNTTTTIYTPTTNVVSLVDTPTSCSQYTYPTSGADLNDPTDKSVYTPGLNITETACSGTLQTDTSLTYQSSEPGDLATSVTGGNTTTYSYDNYGDQTGVTAPAGITTSYSYNVLGQKESMVTPDGTTTYTYDGYGNLTQTTDPLGHTTKQTYDPLGNQLTTTDANNNTTTNTYDADGQLIKTVNPDGTTITDSYDAAGRKTATTDTTTEGNTTSYTYDPRGDLLTQTSPLGEVTSYTYDGNGNMASQTDPAGNTTTYTYNGDNQLTKTTQPDGTTLAYAYDADGNQISYTDANNDTTTYTYNPQDQLIGQTDPAGNATTYTYNPDGTKATQTNPDGQTTTWSYTNGQLTSITGGTAPVVTYTYAPDGKIATMTDGPGTTTYTYDTAGRLTNYQNGAGATVGYGYDNAGNVTSITYPNAQSVTRTYNSTGQLTSVKDWNGNTTSYSYDPDGNPTTITYPNGIVDTRTYNGDDQLTAITDSHGANTLLAFTYTRDLNQSITAETDTGTPNPGTTNYTYNKLSQLTAANTYTYTYDHANNLTTGPSATTQAFNNDSQLCWTGTGTGTCSSPPAGATTYTYSKEGNRTEANPAAGGPTTYSWNSAHALTAITPSSGTATTYTHDANNLLQTETTGTATIHYTWDTQPSLPLLLSDGTNYYIYGTGPGPIEQINTTTGAASYLLSDQLGSTRALTDSPGNLAATYIYDAWGNETGATGTTTTPFLYAGQYHDPASGLYYMRARWYDPTNGQFLSQDPEVAGTQAPYNYGNNNPVNEMDPSGDSPPNLHWIPIHLTPWHPTAWWGNINGLFEVQLNYGVSAMQWYFLLSPAAQAAFRYQPMNTDWSIWVDNQGINYHAPHWNLPTNYLNHQSLWAFKYNGRGPWRFLHVGDQVKIEFIAENSHAILGAQYEIFVDY
jgi:RHS repeat-associated protein